MESHSWRHGVLMGASMASETTAANVDEVGVVRRDPMAMKPFCGYNFGDYWTHWMSFDGVSDKLPDIFHVNWFRKDANGKFMWPGFGENIRVLDWIIKRCEGKIGSLDTPIGNLPLPGDLNLEGITVPAATMDALLEVDTAAWREEISEIGKYLDSFGDRTPESIKVEQRRVKEALSRA
jgi:phosphoenolpyruvate carboxykinase (GTP)